MIQLNLLPDVKIAFLKAKRAKRLAIIVSATTAAVSFTLLISLCLIVFGLQKKHLGDLNKDIKSGSQKLQNTPDLNKILTIKNQLNSLQTLHDQKPETARLFTYLGQITPAQITMSKLDIDFQQHTITITGSADSLATINTFVDTLKFTAYHTDKDSSEKPAFSGVVLTNYGLDDKGASYTVGLNFDPIIFDSTYSVTLTVPKKITTRSEVEKPTDLFQPKSNATNKSTQ